MIKRGTIESFVNFLALHEKLRAAQIDNYTINIHKYLTIKLGYEWRE